MRMPIVELKKGWSIVIGRNRCFPRPLVYFEAQRLSNTIALQIGNNPEKSFRRSGFVRNEILLYAIAAFLPRG